MPGIIGVEIFVETAKAVAFLSNAAREISSGEKLGVEKGAKIVERRLKERTNRLDPGVEDRIRSGNLGHKGKRIRSLARRILSGGLRDDFLRVRTGNLRASIGSSRGELNGVRWEARVGFREGFVVPYAAVHEFGTDRAGRSRSVRIPARQPVRGSLADKETDVQAIIRAEIYAAVAKANR